MMKKKKSRPGKRRSKKRPATGRNLIRSLGGLCVLIILVVAAGFVAKYLVQPSKPRPQKARVIKKSIPFGSPPFVASKYLPPKIKEKVRNLLLNMHQDPKGRSILKELMIDHFVSPKDTWYQPVCEIRQQLNVAYRGSDVAQRF